MSDKRTPPSGDDSTPSQAEPASPAADAASADGAAPGDDTAPAEDADAVEEEGPLNRAERRARARKKGAAGPQAVTKIDPHGRQNTGPAPRQWSNRRSG